ncbi:MAG TPA: ubiquinol oxidase subunit II [Candidatus Saccharimonadales bacterium]|nr:ubiquinol oxidase subunit II [Candidatus Saccharimonadales bacterium]
MNKKLKIIILALAALIVLTFIAGWLKHSNVQVFNSAGSVGEKERNLMLFALGLSLIVVIPVYILLFSFAWRYREGSKKKRKYSPELAGNWAVETVWWLIPTALITILSVVAWNSSHALDPYRPLASSKKPMTIQVVALDWKWLFIYPKQHVASVNFVQLPVGTPVKFQITSDAPMNSLWIPQLGGQIYAMPGMSTQLNLIADRAGDYHGSSANISGTGFSRMDFIARAGSESQFNAWVKSAQHSPHRLSRPAYDQLAKPSQDNPVTYYSRPDSDLFGQVILKYIVPQTANGPAYRVVMP